MNQKNKKTSNNIVKIKSEFESKNFIHAKKLRMILKLMIR